MGLQICRENLKRISSWHLWAKPIRLGHVQTLLEKRLGKPVSTVRLEMRQRDYAHNS